MLKIRYLTKSSYLIGLFFLVASLFSCNPVQKSPITAKNGVLDLSSYHFEKEGSLRLNGEWEFYWKQYLQSSDFEKIKPSIFISVPNSWANETIENEVKLGAKGHATYRLRIKLPHTSQHTQVLGIRTQFVGTNHALMIDNELVSPRKNLGTSPEDTDGYVNPSTYFFKAAQDTVEIVLHVANYAGRVGGITQPIFLGTAKQINQSYENNLMISFLLFGVLMIMSGYHFSLYFFRRKESTTLWFALFCLVIGLRILVTDDYYFSDLFPDAPYEFGNKLSYLTFYIGVPLLAIFVNCLFPKEFSRAIVRLYIFLGSLFSIVVIFSKTSFYSQFLQYFQFATLLLILYAVYFVIQIVIKRKEGSTIFAIGMFTIFLAATNDILVANFVLQTPSMMPVGLITFIFSQTVILSKRFSDAFNQIETLTGKLQENNERLESTVMQRTIALNEANESLSKNLEAIQIQNQTLDEANKTKDKLFSIIAHDLRNPVAALRNTIDILDPEILSSDELTFIKAELNRQFTSMDFTLDNLLTWAKAQMKSQELKPENINVRELMAMHKDLYMAMFDSKKLTFVNGVPLDTEVYADLNYLRFILRNLLNNAIKFTETGGTITMSANTEGEWVTLSVQDTGVGMSQQTQARLFDNNVYYSTEGTIGEKGTGLGLKLCKEFVEKNGGKIWVESEIGKGSTFYFTLPKES